MPAGDMNPRLAGRNGEVWKAYTRGRTQEWIAEKFGVSTGTVSTIIKDVREALPQHDKESWRERALESLSEMHARMSELTDVEPQPKFDQRGIMLTTVEGEPVLDYSVMTEATSQALKIQDRMAKMLGLDAPAQSEVKVDASDDVAALLLRARAARREGGASESSGGPA